MLPLPLLETAATGSQRRRHPCRLRAVRWANGALSALNLMLGFSESQPGLPSCDLHVNLRAEVLDRAQCFVERSCAVDSTFSDETALRTLLRGQSCYALEKAGCAVKPFSWELPHAGDRVDAHNLTSAACNHTRDDKADPQKHPANVRFELQIEIGYRRSCDVAKAPHARCKHDHVGCITVEECQGLLDEPRLEEERRGRRGWRGAGGDGR